MQATSSRWGMYKGRGRGRGRAFAKSLLGLWAAINHAPVVSSFSSGTSCPTEGVICAADEVCSVCIDSLRSLSASSLGFESTSVDCDELVFELCSVVDETVCDHSNDKFIALATCTVEDATGCAVSASCTEVLSASPAPSNLEVAQETSTAPTGSPTTVTLTKSPAATTTAAPSGPEEIAEAADASSGGIGVAASMDNAVWVALISGVGLLLAV